MDNSAAGRHLRDGNEINEPIAKKIKPEPDGDPKHIEGANYELSDNLNEGNGKNNENQQQIDKRRKIEEEKHFLNLFTGILDFIIKLKEVKESKIEKHLNVMKNIMPIRNDFTKIEDICAYLYRYASHGAGFARYRILNAINNCEELKNILIAPELKIVSLGSGPGNDAVGFCSALSEFQKELIFLKKLKLTLVDKFKQWSPWIQLAKIFIEEGKFGNVSELFRSCNVELKFVQTDLPGKRKLDEEYFEILKEADVILMSKFLSSIPNEDHNVKINIIKSLHEHANEDVVIIVTDKVDKNEEGEPKDWISNGFQHIYKCGDGVRKDYKSDALAEERFCSNDDIASKLPIYVFKKSSKLK